MPLLQSQHDSNWQLGYEEFNARFMFVALRNQAVMFEMFDDMRAADALFVRC